VKRRLLDLYCKAGGASRGYQRAGFHVTGVDIEPQPNYIGDEFVQGDALAYLIAHGHEYEAIGASPPCQRHSLLAALPSTKGRNEHPNLIGPTRDLLRAIGVPYVIENVGHEAMGIDWMTGNELCEAIPPAYTEVIGHQLQAHLDALAEAAA
jgi:hypothetical protein